MSLERKIKQKRQRRTLRVRSRLSVNETPRVSIFRSAKHIYGQVIDDSTGKTLASCSTLEMTDLKGDKTAVAHQIGKILGKRAVENNVAKVVFDRGPFLYHGRVKAFAEGLREAGLAV